MALSDDLKFKLIVAGVVIGGAAYVGWRGYKAVSDAIGAVGNAASAAYNWTETQAGTATKNTALDPAGAIAQLQTINGVQPAANFNQEEATTLELLLGGQLGA
jgi:predicted negative regulator of RcsB-dependent stress response